MNKKIRLSIPKPCSEQWDSFKQNPKGGYCNSCEKTVVDFSKMSDREIVSYFQNHQSIKTCGRFKSYQLGEIGIRNPKPRFDPLKFVSAGIFGMSLLVANSETEARTKNSTIEINEIERGAKIQTNQTFVSRIIRGIVVDDTGEGLPGVNVVLKGSTTGTVTDLDGKFTFPIELNEGDVLVFCSVGMMTMEHEISSKDTLEVNLKMEMSCDITGEIVIDGLYSDRKGFFGRLWRNVFGS